MYTESRTVNGAGEFNQSAADLLDKCVALAKDFRSGQTIDADMRSYLKGLFNTLPSLIPIKPFDAAEPLQEVTLYDDDKNEQKYFLSLLNGILLITHSVTNLPSVGIDKEGNHQFIQLDPETSVLYMYDRSDFQDEGCTLQVLEGLLAGLKFF